LEISGAKKDKHKKEEIKVTSIIDSVKRVFNSGTENQMINMLSKTLEVKDERFFKGIKNLLNHPSPRVKALAIENLYFLKTENLSAQMESMIQDKDQNVTTSAFRYLLKTINKIPLFYLKNISIARITPLVMRRY